MYTRKRHNLKISNSNSQFLKNSTQVEKLLLARPYYSFNVSMLACSVNFTISKMIKCVYYGQIQEGVCPLRSAYGLARFTLYVLSLKGSLLSDGSLTTSLLLLDCLLDDTRATQAGKIRRYMERKPDDANKRSMVDITFQQKLNSSFGEWLFLVMSG